MSVLKDPARLFWRNFFTILRPAVALGQWTTIAVFAAGLFEVRFPVWAHVIGPLVFLGLNSAAFALPLSQAGAIGMLRRVHLAVGFISLFTFGCVLIVHAGFAAVWVLAQLAAVLGAAPLPDVFWTLALRGSAYGMLMVAAVMVYGYVFGQARLSFEELDVFIEGLPEAFDGLRVVQLSDIHMGIFMSPQQLGVYVDEVNRLAPDLIFITGDIAADLAGLEAGMDQLARLEARLGVIAILGNHDVYCGADRVAELLGRGTTFEVLRDDVAVVESGGARLHVVGIEDRGGPDHFRGLKRDERLDRLCERVPAGSPFVLLTHRPDLFKHAARLGASLVLAGHTHGGQLALPWPRRRPLSIARFITPWARGTYRAGGSVLHVNCGLGVTGQPIRLATPREVTVIRLAKSADHTATIRT